MSKNIKLNYMTDADPTTYDTICPKSRANTISFDNTNTIAETWGGYTIHNPISALYADTALAEIDTNISRFGKVFSAISGISGAVIGMVGYGNMAIYVNTSDPTTIKVYNVNTAASTTIELPSINGSAAIIKDIAIVKIDKQTPEVGLLCHVDNDVYYVAYDVASANALNTGVSYTRVSTYTGGTAPSISSKFIRTKKELVILNGQLGRIDSTYGDLGRVMRSTDGISFTELTTLDGTSDTVYMPLTGVLYCGDDVYSASSVMGQYSVYHPLIFTIEDTSLIIHIQSTTTFNPLGRDLNTGRIMFTTSTGWWEVMADGTLNNFTTFASPQIPTAMVCVNGLKITNAGYYYNQQGLTTGAAIKDTSGNKINPSASQSLLRLYYINDKTVILYVPSSGKWYATTLSTTI